MAERLDLAYGHRNAATPTALFLKLERGEIGLVTSDKTLWMRDYVDEYFQVGFGDSVIADIFTELASTSSTQGTALIGSVGITGITPLGGTSGAPATLQNMLAGIPNSFVLKSPYNATVNTIQSTGAAYPALILKNAVGQFAGFGAHLFELQDNTGAAVAYFDNATNLTITRNAANDNVSITLKNSNNTNSNSNAFIYLSVGGDSAGNAYSAYNIFGTQDWIAGVHRSDGYKYKIAASATFGAGSDWISITPAGAITLNGAVSVSSTLSVTGGVTFSNSTSGGPTLTLTSTDTGGRSYIIASGGSANGAFPTGKLSFRDATAGVTRMTIDSTGLVAIAGAATVGTTLGVSGLLTAAGGIDISNGGTGATAGRIYTTASSGTIIWGKAGSATDFLLANSAGANVLTVNTGTIDATFAGSIYIPDSNGIITIISASNRGVIGRSGTTLNIGANGGWTAANYNVASGSHQFGIGGTTRFTIDTSGITIAGTATTTGVHTFTAAPVFSSVSAGQILGVNGSKALVGFSTNGSGSVVLSTSASLTTPDIGIAGGASLTLSDKLIINSLAQNQIALNSSGTNYGFISNTAGNTWALSYGTTITTLGTSALTWNNSGAITIPGTLSLTGAFTAGSDIVLTSSNGFIRSNTADGSDNKSIAIFAANTYDAAGGTRSAGILLTGNEYAGGGGALLIFAGQTATSGIFITPPSNVADCFDINDRAGNIYLTIDTLTSAKFVGVPQLFGIGGTFESAGASHSSGQDAPDVVATPCFVKIKHWNGTTWDRIWVNCQPNKITP